MYADDSTHANSQYKYTNSPLVIIKYILYVFFKEMFLY